MVCEDREQGRTWATAEVRHARAYVKERYLLDGVKRFLYYCPKVECYGMPDPIHAGRRGRPSGRNGEKLNAGLENFYHHWETYKTAERPGLSPSDIRHRKRKTARHRMQFMRWEDDGGPSQPE